LLTIHSTQRQLHLEDRVTKTSLLQRNHSLRGIANAFNRSPSTVIREHSRNSEKEISAVVIRRANGQFAAGASLLNLKYYDIQEARST